MEKQLLQAAERGDAEAQFNLGVMYENGLNDSHYAIEGSRSEAVRWFLTAAEQGLPRAQLKLAQMYAAEPDVPGRLVQACAWFLVAMTGLHGAPLQGAQATYRRAALGLTPAQIADAVDFAETWKTKRPTEAGTPDQPKIPAGARL